MKLDNIKTESEFWDFADVWYQRTKRLAFIMNNETEPNKKAKATKLWFIMYKRMLKIIPIATKFKTFIPKPRFEKGCI